MKSKFPDLSVLSNLPPRTLEENPKQVFLSLGFEPLLAAQGIPLSNVVEYRCAEKYARSAQGKKERYKLRVSLHETLHEVLYHPCGMVVCLNNSRPHGHTFNDSKRSWTLSCLLKANIGSDSKGAIMSTGQKVVGMKLKSADEEDFGDFLVNVRSFHNSGSLLSIQQWGQALRDPVFAYGCNDFMPMQSYDTTWINLALPWMDVPVKSVATLAPFMFRAETDRTMATYQKQVELAINKVISSVPDIAKDLVRYDLSCQLETSLNTKQQKNRSIRNFSTEERSKKLMHAISPYLPNSGLSGQQSEILSQWVEEMLNPSKASALRWGKLPLNIPDVKGFSRLDLALNFPSMLGASHKITHAIQKSSDEQLMKMCSGENSQAPLAYSLARVMLHTENRSYKPDELELLSLIGQVGLTEIVNRLGPEALIWDSKWDNIWGVAAGQQINLPYDEDLVEYQKARTTDFVMFVEQLGVDLPDTVRFSKMYSGYLDPNEASAHTCSLLSQEDFNDTWSKHAREACTKTPHLYWDLLRPAVSLVMRNSLTTLSGSQCQPSTAKPAQIKI